MQSAPPLRNQMESEMHVEHMLAARKIADMMAIGHSKQSAITAATKLVKGQGFPAAYAKQVSEQMAALV